MIFVVYSALVLILTLMKKKLFFGNFLEINKKYIFPLLIFISISLIVIEFIQYPNFVFSKLHINPFYFLFLPLLSALINYVSLREINNHRFFNLIVPLSLIIFLAIKVISSDFFISIFKEDSVAEYLQFGFYLIAAIWTYKLASFYRLKKQKIFFILFLILSIGLFFVAGEEISWGQRLFGIETPESIKEINAQNEITLHNLNIFQHKYLHMVYMIVALYGAFSRILVKKFLPKLFNKIVIFTPPTYLFFCFFSVFVFYFLYDYYFFPYSIDSGKVYIIRWQEVFETYLALGFLGYALDLYRNKEKRLLI